MVKIYCGTQEQLPPEYTAKGTRYQCLRKGVGVGLHLPRERIDALKEGGDKNKPKTYCGNSQVLPPDYVSFATPYACLRKGVGVGMWTQKRRNG